MRLKPEQIPSHLQRGLAPIYLVSGDEPLQVAEAGDAIRGKARELGCSERLVFNAESGFDWNTLLQARDTLSLFAERRVLELRIPSGKPGDAGSRALTEYAAAPPEGDVLLIIAGKIEKESQKSKWFTALDQAGVVVQIWPLTVAQLPAWIGRRMRDKGLQPSTEAVAMLAERVEGNLLACVQEIEKLALLYGSGAVDGAAVAAAVADNARYSVYDLVDRALAGETAAVTRMLRGLQGEGEEPVLVLWALAREIRTLAVLSETLKSGGDVDALFYKYRVWDSRKVVVRAALKRCSPKYLGMLLRQAGRVDRIIKGVMAGDVWDELLQLTVALAGVTVIAKQQTAVSG